MPITSCQNPPTHAYDYSLPLCLFAVEYFDDKKDPDNYVCIVVEIDGLKKKTFKQDAANAKINFEVTERFVRNICTFMTC